VFLKGDMFEAIPEDKSYDIIVCNPPYIKSDVIDTLDVEVKDHEPRMALDGGKDGLDYYRILADEASMHIRSGGYLALEIGSDQGEAVRKLLEDAGTYASVVVKRDLAGLDRVVIAERK
jgi:HemK-like putative methylase